MLVHMTCQMHDVTTNQIQVCVVVGQMFKPTDGDVFVKLLTQYKLRNSVFLSLCFDFGDKRTKFH